METLTLTFIDFWKANLQTYCMWIFMAYALTVVAMAADLAAGIRKAHILGHACNSRGFKRTCDKAMRYFLPMICLTCVDILASISFAAPYLTIIFGVYCIFCEAKSIMESIADKKEIRSQVEFAERVIRESEILKFLIENIIKFKDKTLE